MQLERIRCSMGLTEHRRDLVGYSRPQWETNTMIEIYSETLVRGIRYTLRHFRSGLRYTSSTFRPTMEGYKYTRSYMERHKVHSDTSVVGNRG